MGDRGSTGERGVEPPTATVGVAASLTTLIGSWVPVATAGFRAMTGSLTTTCLFVDAVFFVNRVDLAAGAFRRVGLLPSAAFLSLGVSLGSLFLVVGFFLPTSFFFGTGFFFGTDLFFAPSFLFGAAFFFGPVLRLGAAFFLATALFTASEPLGWRDDRFFVFLALTELVALARPDSRRVVFFFDACPFGCRRAAIRLGFEVRFFFGAAFFSLARRGFDVPDLRVDFAI